MSTEPVELSTERQRRRTERLQLLQKQRLMQRQEEDRRRDDGIEEPLPDADDRDDNSKEVFIPLASEKAKKTGLGKSWVSISFSALVLAPAALIALYYFLIASPQYEVQTQFAVRGEQQSAVASLGLTSLVGASTQASDSYIVNDYIISQQVLRDIRKDLGIDLRTFYAKDNIDFMNKIDASMPIEQFHSYWQNTISISFNSTTGITTLAVYAYTADDATTIADAVMKVSEKLVNQLSEDSRNQSIELANRQVQRSEDRLREVRKQLRVLADKQQSLDPRAIAKSETSIVAKLESELADLRTRQKALLGTVSNEAPSARVIERQISALVSQLEEQRSRISGSNATIANDATETSKGGRSETLSAVMERFAELTLEQEFAQEVYTKSLGALEAALASAQKQDLYFATFVTPVKPAMALYPSRTTNSVIWLVGLAFFWSMGYLIVRSASDRNV